MTRARIAAAAAGIVTALLLQATLVGPLSGWVPLSLPAVLVAAVGLVDGPATGMSFGFAAGLVADLASSHAAGVLALCWMGVGMLAGLVADRRSLRKDALTAGVLAAVGTAVATVVLALVGRTQVMDAVRGLLPSMLGDVLIGLVVLALVRALLHSESLRAPHPVYTELTVGAGRG